MCQETFRQTGGKLKNLWRNWYIFFREGEYIVNIFTMLQIANIRVKLNELKESLDESIRSQDFSLAAEIKRNISELETERNQLLDLPQTQTEEIRTERVSFNICKQCEQNLRID